MTLPTLTASDQPARTYHNWHFPPAASAVRDARDIVSTTCRCWGLPNTVIDDIALVVSELVTNAVQHGQGDVQVMLGHEGAELLVSVKDEGGLAPLTATPSDEDESGRGLAIVATLCTAYGHQCRRDSTTSWARLALQQQA